MSSKDVGLGLRRNGSRSRTSMNESPKRGSRLSNADRTRTQRTSKQDESKAHRVGFLPLTSAAKDAKDDGRAVVWLDIDNTLYRKSTKIAELMTERIRAYILGLGLSEEEAEQLHRRYYKQYGLAIRGLVAHHKIDALEYDSKCDATLPLDDILRPDQRTIDLLNDLDRNKCRIWALTNAYKTHAVRVLRLLHLDGLIEGIIYCDYAMPNFACKPETDFYLGALHHVGLTDPGRCYFVDDSLLNIRAAKQLGWHNCVLFKEEDAANSGQSEDEVLQDITASDFDVGLLQSTPEFDGGRIALAVRKLPEERRLALLRIVLQECSQDEKRTMRQLLDNEGNTSATTLPQLPSHVLLRILAQLSISDLLKCRHLSRDWQGMTEDPVLWKAHACALARGEDIDEMINNNDRNWEAVVKMLTMREQNWTKGLCQSIVKLQGHSGYVTAMKLKGQSTLVTGSYDETIRLWDLTSGSCKKILKAKAISCLDFLPEEGILVAGLYDTGRIMVWDMKTWTLLQTLSGHNHGIRNVALDDEFLVSVGQDKAIVVWDWRSGTKVVRFGQQSNVSLGVSIIDHDKIVAVTVDGIIRTFDISPTGKHEMIGQFDLTKLAPDLAVRLAGLRDGSTMMQWFAAHRNTMTIGSNSFVVHLKWREHDVPIHLGSSTTRPSRRASQTPTKSPSRSTTSSATIGQLTPARLCDREDSQTSPSSLRLNTERNGGAQTPTLVSPTRKAPDLSVSPVVLSIVDVTDGAVGAVDAVKKRIVTSTRFSTRSGADRQLYTTTFSPANQTAPRTEMTPIRGAWQTDSGQLAVPERKPMSLVLDGNHCVVGTSEGLVYAMNFAGSTYVDRPTNETISSAGDAANNEDGDGTIADLYDLRTLWSELFV